MGQQRGRQKACPYGEPACACHGPAVKRAVDRDDRAANGRARATRAGQAQAKTALRQRRWRARAKREMRSSSGDSARGLRRKTGAGNLRVPCLEKPENPTKSARRGANEREAPARQVFQWPIMSLAALFQVPRDPPVRPGAEPTTGIACRVLATAHHRLPRPDFTLPRGRAVWHNESNFSTSLRRFRRQAQKTVFLPILSARGETP